MPRSGDRAETLDKTLQARKKAPAQESILDGGFCLIHLAAIAFYPASVRRQQQ